MPPHRAQLAKLIALPLLALLTTLLCRAIPARATFPPAPAPASPNFSHCIGASPCPELLLADGSLLQQSKALYDAGKFEVAITVLQKAAQAYQTQGDSLQQAIALSNLTLAHQQLGQWQQANDAIKVSLRLLDKPNKNQTSNAQNQNLPILAQTLDIQGDLQLETGQAEQAIITWQRAESIYKQLGDRNGLAQNQINQAQALRELGYYLRALTLLTELRQTLQQQPDSITKVAELRSLGNSLRLVGNLNQSREVLQQGLAIAHRLSPSQDVSQAMSSVLFSLGNTARAQPEPTTAAAFYQQAADLSPTPIGKLQAQINLFSLFTETDQSAQAQTLLPEIQTQLTTLPPSLASVYAHIHLAQALINLEHRIKSDRSDLSPSVAKSAAELLAIATQQAHRLGNRRAEAYALGNLGHVYEQVGQWSEAQGLTQQALNLAQGINAPDSSYRWNWQLGRLLKQQGNIPQAILAYDAAVNELRSLRGDLVAVNRDVQFSFRESVEPIYRESVELLVQTQGGEPTAQNLDKARQRIEALQLAELDNFFREACLDTRTVLLDKVVDQDNPTAAIIYPILLPNQLEVIVKIPQQPLHHHTVKIHRQEVETLLQQLQQNLTELDATDTIQKLSQQVYGWLIAPIVPDLDRQGVNTLVFVLDGALRSIPMAGLYDGQHYLVEKYAVALSIGLQLLPPKSLSAERLHVLAAGLIEPPLAFRQQFPPLPEIKAEFDLIAKAGISTHQLLDQAFTSQALEQQVNSTAFNVVHLATHGQFSSQAKETFILAADGPINVTQLDSLLRRRNQARSAPIELLVLSACQTAEGDNRATLGLAGVAVKAGTRSTLASLWHIDDHSTALLIGEFYRELVKAKVTKAEALRRAQVTLLQQYPNYSRPGYWAAYVLIGNWL